MWRDPQLRESLQANCNPGCRVRPLFHQRRFISGLVYTMLLNQDPRLVQLGFLRWPGLLRLPGWLRLLLLD